MSLSRIAACFFSSFEKQENCVMTTKDLFLIILKSTKLKNFITRQFLAVILAATTAWSYILCTVLSGNSVTKQDFS